MKNNKICVRHIKTPWSKEDCQKLLKMAPIYKFNWKLIALEVFSKKYSVYQCKGKYEENDPQINHGPWSQKEENLLLEGYEILGERWSVIAQDYLNGKRNRKQCRIKYMDLTKNSGEWSKEEDAQLMKLYEKYKTDRFRWTKIAKDLDNKKTNFQCGQHYRSLISNVKNWKDEDNLILAKGFLYHGSEWSKIACSCFNNQYTIIDLFNKHQSLLYHGKWQKLIETVKEIKAEENKQSSSSTCTSSNSSSSKDKFPAKLA